MKLHGEGETLASLIGDLSAPCGGRGTCGKCRVIARGELSEINDIERLKLTRAELDAGMRLACQARALGEVEVTYEADAGDVLLAARKKALKADPGRAGIGAAIDLGTTTLAVYRVDLATGEIIETASRMNPQRKFGADVISRIEASLAGENLTGIIRETLAEMAGENAASVTVGNTCMTQLLMGMSVEGISRAPFTPGYTGGITRGKDYVAPIISGFVGADSVAAAIYAELDKPGETRLLLDVGTNGEMLIAHNGQIYACAAAAGPAFEGAHIACGMGGAAGAINRAELIDDKWRLGVIGGGKPRGICGSGLIDAIAALVKSGAIDESGYMEEDAIIADGVRITQKDVREVQLAKGAIAAGIALLAREAGVALVDKVYLAGGFGSAISPVSALAIGLLPREICGNIESIGNAAGMGAVEILLSEDAKARAESIARRAKYIELSEIKDFQDSFVDNMLF